ncbi:hypothetical protein LZQ00_09985 [Sphingobacterium sp. SRCM116780]|uniref:hypothetical protein n=1 Tax=Sphingobacterium sp. SRCM116780 TaxID=2907623 RepID=UPI001F432424|nr:hypothetical protein [Sphingobacterium sp. SRCM116780]UIR54603.1 hypothetical protein LZQ00_09985 [Sphingobacterium sp. SRCM116780]
MKYLILLFILISCSNLQAQTPASATVNASGWKRVAHVDGLEGRGFGKISLFTIGGSSAPYYLDIEWFKDWTVTGGLSIKSNSKAGFWTGARLTYDNDTTFIEVNFSKELSSLSLLSDTYGWNVAKVYSGALPNGGGTIRAEAKAGQLSLNDQFFVGYNGFVGIGTNAPKEALSVNGNIRAQEIKVETSNWPDYVFKEDYKLKTLEAVASFVKEKGHLPEIPKATDIEKQGYSLNEMDKILLKKIEELTLYLIEKDNELKMLREEMEVLKTQTKN